MTLYWCSWGDAGWSARELQEEECHSVENWANSTTLRVEMEKMDLVEVASLFLGRAATHRIVYIALRIRLQAI